MTSGRSISSRTLVPSSGYAATHKTHVLLAFETLSGSLICQILCWTPQAPSHLYSGHSSHVTNVSFLYDDGCLVSIGGKDMSVMQWRIVWGTGKQMLLDSGCVGSESPAGGSQDALNWTEPNFHRPSRRGGWGFYFWSAHRSQMRWTVAVVQCGCKKKSFSSFDLSHYKPSHTVAGTEWRRRSTPAKQNQRLRFSDCIC